MCGPPPPPQPPPLPPSASWNRTRTRGASVCCAMSYAIVSCNRPRRVAHAYAYACSNQPCSNQRRDAYPTETRLSVRRGQRGDSYAEARFQLIPRRYARPDVRIIGNRSGQPGQQSRDVVRSGPPCLPGDPPGQSDVMLIVEYSRDRRGNNAAAR